MVSILLGYALQAATAAVPAVRARPAQRLLFYVGNDDYPSDALSQRRTGVVAFILDVTPQGRVAACRVTASSGTPSLDEASCQIMRIRARFRPARDAAGRATSGTFYYRLGWRLQ